MVGNELADVAAKNAVKRTASHDLTCSDVPPHPFADGGMYWVAAKDPETTETDNMDTTSPEGGEVEKDEPHYLGDLRKGLDGCVRAACCTGAAASAPGIYAEAWEQTRKSALGDISNTFTTTATLAQRRTVWKTRAGLLMNKKLEQRWFKTGDGNCPLCGQPDSCTHIASGCPKLSGLYTERHNKAARILLKSILKGRLGGRVIQADIGSADKLSAMGLTLADAHRQIPKDQLPTTVTSDPIAYQSLSRPDATVECNDPPRIEVLEVKICRDTDRSVQLERADKQHASLITHMRNTNSRVNLVTFAFGATGTIYTDNLDQLITLGVDRATARKTLRKIHISLVHDLHTIVCSRRAQEWGGTAAATSKPYATQPTHRTHKGRNR
jgi:hypothetical protein